MTIMTKMGISQYFFRTRRNDQNSRRNDSIGLKIGLSFRRRPRRRSIDPITHRIRIAA